MDIVTTADRMACAQSLPGLKLDVSTKFKGVITCRKSREITEKLAPRCSWVDTREVTQTSTRQRGIMAIYSNKLIVNKIITRVKYKFYYIQVIEVLPRKKKAHFLIILIILSILSILIIVCIYMSLYIETIR